MEVVATDTDVVIDFLRGKGPYIDDFTKLLEKGKIVLVVISAYELFIGASSVRKEGEIAALIEKVSILGVDLPAARAGAKLFKELRGKGVTMGMADALIGGACLTQGIMLMTKNLRHFQAVPHLTLWPGARPSV